MALAVSPRTTLRASVSRFYQPPQPEFLLLASSPEARALSPFIEDGGAASDGGADIEPERQWAFDAGVEHRVGRGWRVDLSYWQRHVDQYADPNVFVGTTIIVPNAVAEGQARGVDARLEFAPGGAWSGYGNVSVGKVTQTGPITAASSWTTTSPTSGPASSSCPITISGRGGRPGDLDRRRAAPRCRPSARFESGTPIELDDDAEAEELAARPGADRVDFDRGRVEPRTVVSLVASVPVWRTSGADLACARRCSTCSMRATHKLRQSVQRHPFRRPAHGVGDAPFETR